MSCHAFSSQAGQRDLDGLPYASPGRINIDSLNKALPHLDMDFHICGPRGMMTELSRDLQDAGVHESRIHTESFTGDHRPDDRGLITSAQHEIVFPRSNRSLLWDSEFRNLLEFAESNGIAMEAGCMFGECGACAVKVRKGEVEYNYTTATKPQAGHCLPCSCRPRSPMSIDA